MREGESLNVPVSFHVSYRLGEYLRLVSAHIVADLARVRAEQGKRVRWHDLLILRACLYLFIPPIFLFKVLTVGSCDFKFDEAGIVRRTRHGELVVPWAEVVAIHAYPAGYLFAQSDGALPVPLRVLSDEQLVQLKKYIAQHAGMRDDG